MREIIEQGLNNSSVEPSRTAGRKARVIDCEGNEILPIEGTGERTVREFDVDPDLGGEAACWVNVVCPECGAVIGSDSHICGEAESTQ